MWGGCGEGVGYKVYTVFPYLHGNLCFTTYPGEVPVTIGYDICLSSLSISLPLPLSLSLPPSLSLSLTLSLSLFMWFNSMVDHSCDGSLAYKELGWKMDFPV